MSGTPVMTSTEARSASPGIGEQIERLGLDFKLVLFGSHRRPVGAIIPAALLEQVESLLEDVAISKLVAARLATGPGQKVEGETRGERLGEAIRQC